MTAPDPRRVELPPRPPDSAPHTPGDNAAPERHRQLEDALETIGTTRAHKQIATMLLLGAFFDAVEVNAVGLTGPVLQLEWGTTVTQIGVLNTIGFGAAALGRVVTGMVGDKLGRRLMLTVGLLVFCLGAGLSAIAPTYEFLAFARFVAGFGLGGEIAIAVTMLSEFFPARHRGPAVGLVNVAAAGFGNMLAPAFGLAVYAIFTGPDRWRMLFALMILPAVLVVFYRRYVPETPRFLLSRGRIEDTNAVLDRLSSGRLHGVPRESRNWVSAVRADEIVVPDRNHLRDVFRGRLRRRTLSLGVAVTMSYGAQISVLTLMPVILISQGYTITKSLVFTLVMQSGSLAGAVAGSTIARYLPRKRVLAAAGILGCGAAFCFGFLAADVALVLIFGALFNFAVIVLNTSIWIFAPELYPTRVRAFGTALILGLGSAAGGLTPVVAGMVFDRSGIPGMFVMLGCMFAVVVAAVQIPPETFGRSIETEA